MFTFVYMLITATQSTYKPFPTLQKASSYPHPINIFPRKASLFDFFHHKCIFPENSLVVQWLGLCASTAMGPGSIPGWGTKIPQAVQPGQKKKAFFLFFLE